MALIPVTEPLFGVRRIGLLIFIIGLTAILIGPEMICKTVPATKLRSKGDASAFAEPNYTSLTSNTTLLEILGETLSVMLASLNQNDLRSVLCATSATAASLLVASIAFLYNLEQQFDKELHDVTLLYDRTIVSIGQRVERNLIGTGSTRRTRSGEGRRGDVRFHWSTSSFDRVPESIAWIPDAPDLMFRMARPYLALNVSESVLPDDKPIDFNDKDQLGKLIEEMGGSENSIRIWQHFVNGMLTIQSSLLTKMPEKLGRMRKLLRRLFYAFIVFMTTLAASILWIISKSPPVGLSCLIGYSVGWVLTSLAVWQLRLLIRRPPRRRRDYSETHMEIGMKL